MIVVVVVDGDFVDLGLLGSEDFGHEGVHVVVVEVGQRHVGDDSLELLIQWLRHQILLDLRRQRLRDFLQLTTIT